MTYLLTFIALHPLLAVMYVLWARTRSNWIAAPALVIDVLLNFTTASILWGWPKRGEWTISKRLKRQRGDTGRRGWLVHTLAEWLNRHDPGHV
jgi:hypothetical protein